MLLDEKGGKLIDDHTLVALTIMIAESKPDEKEIMISIIMNCIRPANRLESKNMTLFRQK